MPAAAPRPLVAVTEPIHAEGIALLRQSCDVALLYDPGVVEETVWPRADGLIIRTAPLPAEKLARCPRLKAIGKHGTGIDNIPLAAATAAGIAVVNTPGANALAVAEGAVTLMLALVKRLRAGHDLVASGRFAERGPWRGGDISGRTLGLVGGGRIARELARICGRGFDMKVLLYVRGDGAARAAEIGATYCPRLDDLLAASDVVSVHVPLSAETRGMIGGPELARLKPWAILVNTARGGIVDEAALVAALRAGKIAGAGIDVFAEEPPPTDHPLFKLPNVVLSPHVAGITEDSTRRLALDSVRGVLDVLAGRKPEALCNPEVWDRRRR